VHLSVEQGRVIGCLIEKQLTTPQQYPLTLNALVLACNQTSNREPVVSYEEGIVQRALTSLKELGLVRFVYPSSGRSATRYRQAIAEPLSLEVGGLALIAVLLLRGPQTSGELRTRSERMTTFDGLGSVTSELERMAAGAEPLVRQLSRRPGQKEERWVQLLTPEPRPGEILVQTASAYRYPERTDGLLGGDEWSRRGPQPTARGDNASAGLADDLAALRAEVAELRAIVEQLRADLSP
jgi:uncharacterized protein YceH (UPF0502 family)